MGSHNIPQLNRGIPSDPKFSSEPRRHDPRWDTTSQLSSFTYGQSRHERIPPVDYDAEKESNIVLQHSQFLPEKATAQCSAVELSVDSLSTTSSVEPSQVHAGRWRPTFLRIGPLVGLAALVLAFLQIFASYAVLNLSDGRDISSWMFKPSVYIAIFTAISNGAISFAMAQGAVVTFWLRPLRGTSLAQLHRDWASGSALYNALRSGKHVSLLAMACVFATLVCIDGPLLQRASSTQSSSYDRSVNLNISVVPEVPSYFTGPYDAAYNAAAFSKPMLPIMSEYGLRTPITSGIQGCTGRCTATIRAPALLPYQCNSNITWKNFSAPYTRSETKQLHEGGLPLTRQLFKTSLTSRYGEAETLDFYTYLTDDAVATTCAGHVNMTHCDLRSAIAEYEVLVINGTITLKDSANPRFISWANNTAITKETIDKFGLQESQTGVIKTTLGGIVAAFDSDYAFIGTAEPPKEDEAPGVLTIGLISQPWFMYQQTTNYELYSHNEACTYAWKDVRSATMAALNELMFRIGVYVADNYDYDSIKDLLDPGVQTHYTVVGRVQSSSEVFRSDFVYYFIAAALELLSIILVASTFWGYWRLGRHVSFSPLEIAKAFDAPLLAGVTSSSGGRHIASITEDQKVQYGIVYSDAAPSVRTRRIGTLMISHREKVHEPESRSVCV